MKLKTIAKLCLTVAIAAAAVDVNLPTRAMAQGLSCDQMWYERNQIYAHHGYCFQTERARAAFGPGCFPPYGQLSGWEANRVQQLQTWERRSGC